MPFKFGVDSNGNYGYIKAGADTVTPFLTRTGNATAANVLSGKTFSNASSSGLTGTMPNLSANATITHAADNSTKVILADAAFISTNSDGVKRFELRYVGEPGYIVGNTLFAVDLATVGQNTLPGTATAADITKGKTAWVFGELITGTRPAPLNSLSGTISPGIPEHSDDYQVVVNFDPPFDTVPKVTYNATSGDRYRCTGVNSITRKSCIFHFYSDRGSTKWVTVNWTATA